MAIKTLKICVFEEIRISDRVIADFGVMYEVLKPSRPYNALFSVLNPILSFASLFANAPNFLVDFKDTLAMS